jgi:hypothetical protein
MTRAWKALKILIVAIIGSLIISLLEIYILEESFYKLASQPFISIGSYGQFIATYKKSHELICPENFEMKLYSFLISDRFKENPYFNPFIKIKNTKYINYPSYFVNADNDEDIKKAMSKIDQQIEICDYIINSNPILRILTLTFYTALQPIHLILGWIVLTILIKIAIIFYKFIPRLLPNWIIRLGYFVRGIFRKMAKLFKDYEDLGK